MKSKNIPFKYIDIFAGCGGISLGLHNSGFKGVFAIEKDDMAFETLNFNLGQYYDWPKWLPEKAHNICEIVDLYEDKLKKLNRKIDLVVGGPPCQGFSMAGKRDKNDSRNDMVDYYIRFIELVKPKILLFENVFGFTTMKKNKKNNISYAEYVKEKLEDLGYNIDYKLIDFSEYGIPQRRKRFILVGVYKSTSNTFFEDLKNNSNKYLLSKGLKNKVTVENAISDLLKKNGEVTCQDSPSYNSGKYGKICGSYQKLMRNGSKDKIPDSHRFSKHSNLIIEKFEYILKNSRKNISVSNEIKTLFNTKKRTVVPLDPASTSPTLTTLPDDYIHYCEPRILTVREYARIQSFPDSFKFKGKYTTGGKMRKKEVPRYTQIGNAIPPMFGEQVGLVFNNFLKNNE